MTTDPHGDIVAIVLAAGASRRMGRPKLHLPWGDSTILGRVLATLRAAGLEAIVVAARAGDAHVAEAARAAGAAVAWVEPRAGAGGDCPTPSLQAALALAAPDGGRAVLVMPGDLPLVRPATVARLVAALRAAPDGSRAIVGPVYEGRRGHPMIFGAAHVPALAALAADRWPRDVVRNAGASWHGVVVADGGVAADIDGEVDYARMRPRRGPNGHPDR